MALEANGQRFCKVVHSENGRTTTRRVHTLMVQAADGRLHTISGDRLPDSISLYSGVPHAGAHVADVLLNPVKAPGVLLGSITTAWLSKRDAFFLALGMFFFRLIVLLADGTYQSLVAN